MPDTDTTDTEVEPTGYLGQQRAAAQAAQVAAAQATENGTPETVDDSETGYLARRAQEDKDRAAALAAEIAASQDPDSTPAAPAAGDSASGGSTPAAPAGPQREDYEALTNDALQELLRDRELPVSGNKAELIDRLVESDAQWAMTVDELQDALAAKDLPTSGRKAQLIARLNGTEEPE